MAEQPRDHWDRHSVHHRVTGMGMAEIVKANVLDARLAPGAVPERKVSAAGPGGISWGRKDEQASAARPAFENAPGRGIEGNDPGARLAVGEDQPVAIDFRPAQPKDLAPAASGQKQKPDDICLLSPAVAGLPVQDVMEPGYLLPGQEAREHPSRVPFADAAIARLRPREREYTVWDSLVVGLGVRVRPTGGRSYVLLEDAGGRSRRVSLGPVLLKTIAEVRRECHARKAEPEATGAPRCAAPLFRDFVEGAWKEAHFDGYKSSTKKGVRSVLDRQLLPAFGSKPLDRIAPAQIGRWFDRFSRTAPGNANHALDLLTQIINFAIARGHLETNPARDAKRNPRRILTRFLSREEVARLHRVLDRQTRDSRREQADIIRLLLLTGCRRSEILRLRWSEVDRDRLVLADGKTGPRIVPLNTQARRILERRLRGASPFVFPSPRDPARPRSRNLPFWDRARREAGIQDVRLHDLRHTHASHAVLNGVPVPVVARLLGHADVRTTLRYAHLGDREIQEAAERVGQAISTIMDQ